jgi:predicted ester cyclase
MSAEELKALKWRFVGEMNKGKAAAMAIIDETCATNMVFHSSSGKDIYGLKDYKQFNSDVYDAFPDVHFTVDDTIVEGDKAVTRHTFAGTHRGEWRGVPPTNKKVTFWAIMIVRIVGGKQVEIWERSDTLGLMQQLGVVPASKKEE